MQGELSDVEEMSETTPVLSTSNVDVVIGIAKESNVIKCDEGAIDSDGAKDNDLVISNGVAKENAAFKSDDVRENDANSLDDINVAYDAENASKKSEWNDSVAEESNGDEGRPMLKTFLP